MVERIIKAIKDELDPDDLIYRLDISIDDLCDKFYDEIEESKHLFNDLLDEEENEYES